MRRLTIILAMVALLGTANTCPAGVCVSWWHIEDLGCGLDRWLLYAQSDGELLNTMSFYSFSGGILGESAVVHQVFPFGALDTPHLKDVTTYAAAYAKYDTHVLIGGAAGDYILNGSPPVETCSTLNEYNVPGITSPPTPGGPGAGMGTHDGSNACYSAKGDLASTCLCLMQVVIPTGTCIYWSGNIVTTTGMCYHFDDAVMMGGGGDPPPCWPEPSSLVMLIAGAVCLVGWQIRRRRRAA